MRWEVVLVSPASAGRVTACPEAVPGVTGPHGEGHLRFQECSQCPWYVWRGSPPALCVLLVSLVPTVRVTSYPGDASCVTGAHSKGQVLLRRCSRCPWCYGECHFPPREHQSHVVSLLPSPVAL